MNIDEFEDGNIWTVEGYDTFSRESYELPGIYFSEEEAVKFALEYLEKLEKQQPKRFSGGQSGIQDQVFVIRPDGSNFRVIPQDK